MAATSSWETKIIPQKKYDGWNKNISINTLGLLMFEMYNKIHINQLQVKRPIEITMYILPRN